MIRPILLAAAALWSVPAMSQTRSITPPTEAIDPARLVAARAVVDQVFPPATRDQMMQGMIASMSSNLRQSFMGNPQFAAAIGSDPRVKALFDKFMDGQLARSSALLSADLPGMADAMARAYARRFDLTQLHDLSVFFATPTGRVYTGASMTIMSDPDIAAWQSGLMTKSMGHMQEDVAALTKEILALKPTVKVP